MARGFRSGPPMSGYPAGSSASLADILERVLDKGIVIAGDIRINLLDIELLTIKLRILIASVDKAKEMGIDWWEHDASLSSRHHESSLAAENQRLRAEIEQLRRDRLTASSGLPDDLTRTSEERAPEEEEERPVRRTAKRRTEP
ncbi:MULTISPECIES: gas vesicle protein [Streptomyces]|uniref:Gas vesicle protein n=2 Tax=Streptomyces TaxID=1883 RepID=A0ABU4KG05_9ACTN|nr:gas vesicle protein [Streptomyces roseolus]MDX2296722.1 gas vesicle protein [Streptomyces roseolus]